MARATWQPQPWIELGEGAGRGIRHLAVSPDGKWIGATCGDRVHVLGGDLEISFPGGGGVAFAPHGRSVLTAVDGSSLCLRSIEDGSIERRWEGQGQPIQALASNPQGQAVVTAGAEEVHLWDLGSAGQVRVLARPRRPVQAVAFSPDGALVATRSQGELRVLDVVQGRPLVEIQGLEGPPCAVAFSVHSRLVATGRDGRSVGLWRVEDGSLVRAFSAGDHARAVAFSADGRLLAAGGEDHRVTVWSLDAVGGPERLEGPVRAVRALAFAPDSRRLLAGADCLHVWGEEAGAWGALSPCPSFVARIPPGARGSEGLDLPATAGDFCAGLDDLPWFSRIGHPSPWDGTCRRALDWNGWPGPEDAGVSALFEDEQRWWDAVVRFSRTWGRHEVEVLFRRVVDQVVDCAARAVPFDADEDALARSHDLRGTCRVLCCPGGMLPGTGLGCPRGPAGTVGLVRSRALALRLRARGRRGPSDCWSSEGGEQAPRGPVARWLRPRSTRWTTHSAG